MLELLEELEGKERKVFQQHIHIHELTALSLNGIKGQALVMTNRYLYLIYTGFFKTACHKISPGQLVRVEILANSLTIETAERSFVIKVPARKIPLLPALHRRLHHWHAHGAEGPPCP